MKKNYVKPFTEFIQMQEEGALLRMSPFGLNNNNWMQNKDQQAESSDAVNAWTAAPSTRGDALVEPGGTIDWGAKSNSWDSWE